MSTLVKRRDVYWKAKANKRAKQINAEQHRRKTTETELSNVRGREKTWIKRTKKAEAINKQLIMLLEPFSDNFGSGECDCGFLIADNFRNHGSACRHFALMKRTRKFLKCLKS